MSDPTTLSNAALSDAYESACAMAASLYAQGADTSTADAHVDVLLAEITKREDAS